MVHRTEPARGRKNTAPSRLGSGGQATRTHGMEPTFACCRAIMEYSMDQSAWQPRFPTRSWAVVCGFRGTAAAATDCHVVRHPPSRRQPLEAHAETQSPQS